MGADVLIVDSLIPQYGGNLFNLDGIEDRVKVNLADLRDRHVLPRLVRGRDVIFNLVGQTSHLDSMTDPLTDLEINTEAQLHLLEACRKEAPSTRIVFAEHAADLRRAFVPAGGRKASAGAARRERHQQAGRRVLPPALSPRLRPAGEQPPPDQHLRAADARQGRAADVPRHLDPAGTRRQAVRGLGRRAAARFHLRRRRGRGLPGRGDPGDRGQGLQHRRLPAAEPVRPGPALLAANGGGSSVIKPFPADRKKIDIGDYHADDTAFRDATGWRPRVDMAEGLARTLAFYRDNLRHYTDDEETPK